jgi:hypothetical protein
MRMIILYENERNDSWQFDQNKRLRLKHIIK